MLKKCCFGALLILFVLVTSCANQATDQTQHEAAGQPNILWIVAEDISPALGAYGDPLAVTPHIDRLATEGVRYTHAFATAPICAPSRSCLVTGLYATAMGTQHLRCEIPFPESLLTLPEHFNQAGYFTSNRNKTDYNFDPDGLWTHWSGSYAPWRQRTNDQPFFSFINVGPSHEGSVNNPQKYEEEIKALPENQKTNPQQVNLPPYYPETPDSREVWAHYYDMLRLMDANVGRIIDSLETDGLLDETIIFFFGDHGFGMPRYKRWLYNTGLNVPLIVRVPPKFKHLLPKPEQKVDDKLVSFVDFAPTALHLAGLPVPDYMQGQAFLGKQIPEPRTHVFGARDRADDMMENSRAIIDNRYIYIRHYMPHLPYMQSGFIYSDVKHAFRALREAHEQGITNTEQEKLWQSKPLEELYDLQEDPQELQNLADKPDYAELKASLHKKLNRWMIDHKDLGLLPEAEYMIRSEGSTPYDIRQDEALFPVEDLVAAAEKVGTTDIEELLRIVEAEDSGVRYWGVMAMMQLANSDDAVKEALNKLLDDPSPSVQILAAEALLQKAPNAKAVDALGKWVQDDRPWLALQAARSIQLVGEYARPLVPIIYQVLEKNLGEPGGRLKYKNFNYSAFTSWALEWALQELGEDIKVN